MAVVVGRAEKIMPARQLRRVLGWFDQGQRQQGHDAGRQMIHIMITLALASLAWPFSLHSEVAAMSATFYCGREHAQAEYRAIKSFYDGKRTNAPWWCGFERRAWNSKSMMDWLGPVAVAAAVMVI